MLEKGFYNLTDSQKNIWDTELYFSNSSLNNNGGYVFIESEVNLPLLEQAINLYNQFLSLTSESDLFPYVCSLVRINGNVLEEAETVVDEMKLELERYEAEHV